VSCVTGGAVNDIGAHAKARRKTSGGVLCFLRAFVAAFFWVGAGGYVLSMIPNPKFALDRQDAYPTRQARCLSHLTGKMPIPLDRQDAYPTYCDWGQIGADFVPVGDHRFN
jgi:hypothetical protein